MVKAYSHIASVPFFYTFEISNKYMFFVFTVSYMFLLSLRIFHFVCAFVL